MILVSTGKNGTTNKSSMNNIAAINDVLCAQMLNAPVFSLFKNASQYKFSKTPYLCKFIYFSENKELCNFENKKPKSSLLLKNPFFREIPMHSLCFP